MGTFSRGIASVSSIVLWSVPVFLALIAIEFWADRRQGRGYYSAVDSFASLSLGVWSITTKVILVGGGAWLYQGVLNGYTLFAFDDVTLVHGVVAFVAYDFFYYWFHRISHERNFFWASHVVHHQSEEYNLTTALRQTSTGFLGFIFYLPLYVIGFSAELLATVAALNLVYQFWVHTRFVGRLGLLDRVLVTPSNHRVHHAQNPEYIDKNHGGVFILWDRIFGTFAEERDDIEIAYGVTRPLKHASPFAANLQVWWSLLSDAIRTARWQDALKIWWAPTGWRPNDVASRYPIVKSDLHRFRPYRPQVSRDTLGYIWLQLLVAVVFGVWFIIASSQSVTLNVIVWCLVSWPLLSAAWVIHRPSIVFISELLRVAVTLGVTMAFPSLMLWSLTCCALIGLFYSTYLAIVGRSSAFLAETKKPNG